jgi:hypothetical protein
MTAEKHPNLGFSAWLPGNSTLLLGLPAYYIKKLFKKWRNLRKFIFLSDITLQANTADHEIMGANVREKFKKKQIIEIN